VQPDFVVFSFYKMFGYPTGLGALLIRRRTGDIMLNRTYFGGGTVDMHLGSGYGTFMDFITSNRQDAGVDTLAESGCYFHSLVIENYNDSVPILAL
jgi:selenocysteine lyase/cysteine desulfurase